MTQPDPGVVLVLTTLDASTDALSFANTLVTERLAACVNVLPAMQSVYRWKGTVETAGEQQLLIKTTRERVEALMERVAQLHRYETPELLVIDARDASVGYLAWLKDSVS